MKNLIHAKCRKRPVRSIRKKRNSGFKKLLKPCSDNIKRKKKYKRHNRRKRRKRRIFSGKNFIYPPASLTLCTFAGFYDAFFSQFFDKRKAHIGNCSSPVQSPLLLHLNDNMLYHFFFVFGNCKGFHNVRIALNKFCRRKTHGNSGVFCVVINKMHNGVKATVNSTAVFRFVAEVSTSRSFLIFRHVKRVTYKFVYSFIFIGRNRNDRNSKHRFHRVYVNVSAVPGKFIHHIKRKHHRNFKFHKLH